MKIIIIQIKEWAINKIKVRKCFIAELFKQVILVITGEVRLDTLKKVILIRSAYRRSYPYNSGTLLAAAPPPFSPFQKPDYFIENAHCAGFFFIIF